jgi:cytochrome c oxidase subunit II
VIDPAQNYTFGLPVAASTYARQLDNSLHILHVAMALIFVLWGIFFVYCLVRFRRRAGHTANPQPFKRVGPSFIPDAAILAFEIWLIFFFGLPIWSHVKENFPDPAISHVVDMVAEQFTWGFQHAGTDRKLGRRDPAKMGFGNPLGLDETDPDAKDDLIYRNELHVPLGRPTILNMTSKDVVHSFFVPEFRVKQDVVPGMLTRLWFEPTKAGRYEIGCAQLCGTGHYVMRGEVVVHTPEDYDAWQKERLAERAGQSPQPVEQW